MKIKEDYNIDKLLEYGFEKTDKDQDLEDDDYAVASFDYYFKIGHSRRGQFYYLLITEASRILHILATDPDGSGGIVVCPDVLIKMSIDNVFEITP